MDLDYALDQATQYREKLGETLLRLGSITEDQLLECLGKQHGTPCVDLYKQVIDENVVGLIKKEVAQNYKLIPIGFKKGQDADKLVLAMANPLDHQAASYVSHLTGYRIYPVFVREEHLKWIINYYYKDARMRVTVDISPAGEKSPGRASGFSRKREDAEEIIVLDTPLPED